VNAVTTDSEIQKFLDIVFAYDRTVRADKVTFRCEMNESVLEQKLEAAGVRGWRLRCVHFGRGMWELKPV